MSNSLELEPPAALDRASGGTALRALRAGPRVTFFDMVVQAALVWAAAFIILRLWELPPGTPITYTGDGILELSLVKAIADGGWIWMIERLGAPFGLHIAAFPQNLTASSAVMKVISLFTSDPGAILNGFWFYALTLTGLVAHNALRYFGISRNAVWVLATLYALLPYALWRNTAHISLTYIFVPAVGAFALQLVVPRTAQQGEPGSAAPFGLTARAWTIVALVAVGFDYVYTAFFTCFFVIVAALVARLNGRRWREVRPALAAVALVSVCVALNFLPTFQSWSAHGKPPNMDYKNPAEAEILGLKIRHVVTPLVADRLFPGHAKNFPLENENATAKLGVVGAIAYVAALLSAFYFSGAGTASLTTLAAGRLCLAGTLLATIGGFGAIFNLVVSPDIRAYNRIVVFLAFFAFVVFGLLLDTFVSRLRSRLAERGRQAWMPFAGPLVLGPLLVLGLADQGLASRDLTARYASDAKQAQEERAMVSALEKRMPELRRIFQLPETSFPPDGGRARMGAYDHGRPYLWSQRAQWSWPSFSQQRERWWRALGEPGSARFLSGLVASGFDGIWVDRYGYTPQDLKGLEDSLVSTLGKPTLSSSSGRYQLYGLDDYGRQWKSRTTDAERTHLTEDLFSPVLVEFGSGFYQEESAADGKRSHRWSQKESMAEIVNTTDRPRKVEFQALLSGYAGGTLTATAAGRSVSARTDVGGSAQLLVPLELGPRGRLKISFVFDGARIDAPGDPRVMYVAFVNTTLREVRADAASGGKAVRSP